MKRKIYLATCGLFVLLAMGCASRITKTTENGLYSVDMIHSETVKAGRNVVDLIIRDSEGRPLEGADIEVTPWMPSMGHGVPYIPSVTEKGRGLYNVVFHFSMAGPWELRINIRKGDTEDKVIFEFPDVK